MSKVRTKIQIRRNRILRTLLDNGEMSLTNLARSTGISLPMVSSIVSGLKRERYVIQHEDKKNERVGRPPIMAKLNGRAGFVLGIDMGHLNTNMVLLNFEKNMVAEFHKVSIPLGNDPSLVDGLTDEISGILKDTGVENNRLMGIGISVPGIVRGRLGISETYLNFSSGTLKELLEKRWGKTVLIEHDAKAMAMGERWFGAAKNAENALCLNIGWGLGLGIILEGRIYYGRDGYAGEFGHIQIVQGGRLCQCGKRGCLETVASGRAIAQIANERLSQGAVSRLAEIKPPEGVDAEQVVRAAMEGDQFCIEILEEAGRYLGEGAAKLINLFNPELIILGGRVSGARHFILDPVRAAAVRQSLVQLNRGVKFAISELGVNAGALGVAMLAAEDLFEVEHLNPTAYV